MFLPGTTSKGAAESEVKNEVDAHSGGASESKLSKVKIEADDTHGVTRHKRPMTAAAKRRAANEEKTAQKNKDYEDYVSDASDEPCETGMKENAFWNHLPAKCDWAGPIRGDDKDEYFLEDPERESIATIVYRRQTVAPREK